MDRYETKRLLKKVRQLQKQLKRRIWTSGNRIRTYINSMETVLRKAILKQTTMLNKNRLELVFPHIKNVVIFLNRNAPEKREH